MSLLLLSPSHLPCPGPIHTVLLQALAPPHASSLHTGVEAAGDWLCMGGDVTDLAGDQTLDDNRSLTFTSPPLPHALRVLGLPTVRLSVAADQPHAFVVVRVCEVDVEVGYFEFRCSRQHGVSMLISRGVLNLAHRNSHAHPELLVPGTRYSVSFPLKGLCRTIRKVRTALKAPLGTRMHADAEGQSTSGFFVDVVLAVGVAVCTARPHYIVRSVLS
jgi:hypothetical protein